MAIIKELNILYGEKYEFGTLTSPEHERWVRIKQLIQKTNPAVKQQS